MSAKIIDGKKISEELRLSIAEAVKNREAGKRAPGLAVIIVGNNPASRIYVNNKKKACEMCGFTSYEYALAENADETEQIGRAHV